MAGLVGTIMFNSVSSSPTEKAVRNNTDSIVRHYIADRRFMDYLNGIAPNATFESHVTSHPGYKNLGDGKWSVHMVPDDIVESYSILPRQDSLTERCVSFAANSVGIIASAAAVGGFITTMYNQVYPPCKIATFNGKADDGTTLNVYYAPDTNTACSDRLAQDKIEEALKNACDGFNHAGMNAGCIYIGEGNKSSGQFQLSTGTLAFSCGNGRQVCTNIPDDQGGHDELRRRQSYCENEGDLCCIDNGGNSSPYCMANYKLGCDHIGIYGEGDWQADPRCKGCSCSPHS